MKIEEMRAALALIKTLIGAGTENLPLAAREAAANAAWWIADAALDGEASANRLSRKVAAEALRLNVLPCPHCYGMGGSISGPCSECAGTGKREAGTERESAK